MSQARIPAASWAPACTADTANELCHFFRVIISEQGPTKSPLGSASELKPIFQLPCFCAHLDLSETSHKSGKVLLCVKLWVKSSMENLSVLHQKTSKGKFCCYFPQIVSKQAPI